MAIANRGCTFGIATKAFNLDAETNIRYRNKKFIDIIDKIMKNRQIKLEGFFYGTFFPESILNTVDILS